MTGPRRGSARLAGAVAAVALAAAVACGHDEGAARTRATTSSRPVRSTTTTTTTTTAATTTAATEPPDTTAAVPPASTSGGPAPTRAPAAPAPAPAATVQLPVQFGGFPVTAAAGARHLVDAAGRPFLIQGDAAWSLLAQLGRDDTVRYLDDRAGRGVNAILVSLVEHKFATDAPANRAGDPPFRGDPFTDPDPAYFDHVDWVLGQAERRGILVLLVPAYLGYGEGDEGWYQEMADAGPARLRAYGRWVARRFAAHRNVLWVAGGDDNPPDKRLSRAVAEGIADGDPHAVQTAHAAPGTSALDEWGGEPWLTVDTVYTTSSVVGPALAAHRRSDGLPFFLVETVYENEHGASVGFLRAQAYGAILSGATGEVFGNNPIWHFDGPGLYDAPGTWQSQLDSAGSRSMAVLHSVMATVPWWTMQPDTARRVVTGGPGASDAVVAVADGAVAVAYLPTAGAVTVDPSPVAGGGAVRADWIDPTDGRATPVAIAGGRPASITPPGGGRGHDWLLVVRRA